MGVFQMNRDLIPVKLHFFLFNAALSGTVPFLPVYAKQLGISALRVGIIFTFLSFLAVVTKPTFGIIADRFRNVKLMLISLLIVVIIAMLGLNFIPAFEGRTNGDTSCIFSNQTSNSTINSCLEFCELCTNNCSTTASNVSSASTTISCSDELHILSWCTKWCHYNNNTNQDEDNDNATHEIDHENGATLQYGLFTALIVCAWASFNVAVTLTDAACYSVLESRVHLYGQQRLWGVIGWGIFAGLTGYLNNIATDRSKYYDYSPGFYILAVLLLFDIVAVRHLQIKSSMVSRAMCKDLQKILRDPRILIFLVGTFAIGALTGLIRCYLFWYLRVLKASQLLLGLVSVSQCFLGELPFFFFSGWVIRKLGHVNTVTMAFFAYGVRFLAYYFMMDPWWTLILELLQGPAYAVFYAAMTSYATSVSYPGTEATIQGLLGGTFEGLGIATGNLLGGVGFSLIGGRKTFLCAAIVALFGSVGFPLAQNVVKKCTKPGQESVQPNIPLSSESSSNDNERSSRCYQHLLSKQQKT